MNETEKILKELPDKFNNIYFSIKNYTAEVTRDILIPEFAGSYFHSEFGVSFKNDVCGNRSLKECKNCDDKKKCQYYLIFAPKIDENTSNLLKISKDPVKPFILEPPLNNTEYYKINSRFNFKLLLIGNANELDIDFHKIFNELGKRGVGKSIDGKKGTFRLIEPDSLSDNKERKSDAVAIKADSIKTPCSAEEIEIEFTTPVNIVVNKKPQIIDRNSGFTLFILKLYKRLFYLNELYCRNVAVRNYSQSELEQVSRNISTFLEVDLPFNNLERKKYKYENGAKKKEDDTNYGGFTGRVIFRGYLTPYLKMIKLGEYLHIGKYCTFGFGKYKILSIK